jgi:hypothetical protein
MRFLVTICVVLMIVGCTGNSGKEMTVKEGNLVSMAKRTLVWKAEQGEKPGPVTLQYKVGGSEWLTYGNGQPQVIGEQLALGITVPQVPGAKIEFRVQDAAKKTIAAMKKALEIASGSTGEDMVGKLPSGQTIKLSGSLKGSGIKGGPQVSKGGGFKLSGGLRRGTSAKSVPSEGKSKQ